MKLKRNIKEFPPLSGRLQRRFVLPRALQIFRRLSLRMDLRRIWPDLPYMQFVRPAKDAQQKQSEGRESGPVQHTTLNTHIALSPVLTKIVREEYTLPVRELIVERAQPSGVPQSPQGGDSRLVKLIQFVDQKRPLVVRGFEAQPLEYREAGESETSSPGAVSQADEERPAGAARGETLDFTKPDPEVLRALAREHGLDSSSFESLAETFFAEETVADMPAPILPPEMQEYLKLDTEPAPGTKRYSAKRKRGELASGEAARIPTVRSPGPSASDDAPELEMPAGRRKGGEKEFRMRANARQAERGPYEDHGTESVGVLAAPNARRPVVEREANSSRESHEAGGDSAELAMKPAAVQNLVRETLRSLAEPDVEVFAGRVARSIERRIQIDRDWRGEL